MPFKFQSQVIYEQLRIFTKDLFEFTGRLPNYESNGLIKQIRNLAIDLLQEYAEGNVRTDKVDAQQAIDNCIISIAKIAALVDLCSQLKYVDHKTRDKWLLTCDEITKRLYDSRKTLK
jgi:four helix bundle protein